MRLQKTTRNPGRVSCCRALLLCSLLPLVSAEPSNLQHHGANPGTAQPLGEPRQRDPAAAPHASHQNWNLAGRTSLEMLFFFFFRGKNKVIINHLFQFFTRKKKKKEFSLKYMLVTEKQLLVLFSVMKTRRFFLKKKVLKTSCSGQ